MNQTGEVLQRLHEDGAEGSLAASKILLVWRALRGAGLSTTSEFFRKSVRLSPEFMRRSDELFDKLTGRFVTLFDEKGEKYTGLDDRLNNEFICYICKHRCKFSLGRIAAVYTICKTCESNVFIPQMTAEERSAYLDSAISPRFLRREYARLTEEHWQAKKDPEKLEELRAKHSAVQATVNAVLLTFTPLSDEQLKVMLVSIPKQPSGVRFRGDDPGQQVIPNIQIHTADDGVPEPTEGEMAKCNAETFVVAIRMIWFHLGKMKRMYGHEYRWYENLPPEKAGHREKVARIEAVFKERFPQEYEEHAADRLMREQDGFMKRIEAQLEAGKNTPPHEDPEIAELLTLCNNSVNPTDYAKYQSLEPRWRIWQAQERARYTPRPQHAVQSFDMFSMDSVVMITPEDKARAGRDRQIRENNRDARRRELHDLQPKGRKGEQPPKYGLGKKKK